MNVLKCNECNIVIDEMLAFIQNKVSVIDEETLVRVCKSSFTSEEIKKSKSLLFDSIPTDSRKILRKNKGKEERDLGDIVNLFKSAEPDIIPVFVARQLEKLPPIMWDHLDCTKLLKDLMRVKTDMEEFKSTYATLNQLKELKSEFLQFKNDSFPPASVSSVCKVNLRRGAWVMDSGPEGLSHHHNSTINESYNNGKESSLNNADESVMQTRYHEIGRVVEKHTDCYLSKRQRSSAGSADDVVASGGANSPETGLKQVAATSSSAGVNVQSEPQLTHSDNGIITDERSSVLTPLNDDNSGWQRVERRRKQLKYRYSGKSGVARDLEFNFRAAEKKVPVFITNIHSETTKEDIIKYIRSKTRESVLLQKINIKKQTDHSAFKFYVSEAKLSMYLDEKLWPEGIIFRKFVNVGHKNMNRVTSVSGSTNNNNG